MVKDLAKNMAVRGFIFGITYSLLGTLFKSYNLLPKFGPTNIIGAILGYSTVEAAAFLLQYKAEEKKEMARLLSERDK